MITLSLDTTALTASVAILRDDKLLCEQTLALGNTHSVTLLPMIKQMLEEAGLKAKDVELYSVCAGPGSFTGIRIGVATVKGLAFSNNTPCIAVSSLEAMAENLKGLNGVICPVINARRSQVYTALFKSENGAITRLTEDSVMLISELEELISEYDSVWFTGDAYNMVSHASGNVTPELLRGFNAAGAAYVGRKKYLSAEDKSIYNDVALQPVYLKKTQAEREREERISRENN